jgi:hypothetical protein
VKKIFSHKNLTEQHLRFFWNPLCVFGFCKIGLWDCRHFQSLHICSCCLSYGIYFMPEHQLQIIITLKSSICYPIDTWRLHSYPLIYPSVYMCFVKVANLPPGFKKPLIGFLEFLEFFNIYMMTIYLNVMRRL